MDYTTESEKDAQPRSIRLAPEVWEALDADAKRCNRSSVKQLEALLIVYYQLGDVGLDENRIKATQERMSQSRIEQRPRFIKKVEEPEDGAKDAPTKANKPSSKP